MHLLAPYHHNYHSCSNKPYPLDEILPIVDTVGYILEGSGPKLHVCSPTPHSQKDAQVLTFDLGSDCQNYQ